MFNLTPKIGVMAMARSTFDVPFAEEVLEKAWRSLESLDVELVGEPRLLFDATEVREALPGVAAAKPDMLLVLQVSFTDASLTVELARESDAPLMMWSFPEDRTGERLRLNSFCGVNLAGHALSRENLSYEYVHAAPESKDALNKILSVAKASAAVRAMREARVMVIGEHPEGFAPCGYNADEIAERFGTRIDKKDLGEFIKEASALPDEIVDPIYERRQKQLGNLHELEQEPLRKTFKVYEGLRKLAEEKGYDGLAVRCWPQFFTDMGCAACGAMGMMNEEGVPCGCEADTYGVLTSLLMQWLSGEAVFNTDLVDINPEEDTCVFWHCGQAPLSMADPEGPVRGTIHSNRKLPLLSEFSLKPGRITVARIGQSKDGLRLVIGGGEVVRAPLAFSGTAGVAKLDTPMSTVMDRIVEGGVEHHTTVAYGDVRPALLAWAKLVNLPVFELA